MTLVANRESRQHLLSWAALGVVYIVWGTTYLAIRVGVRDVPPLLFAGIRYVAAGALLYPLARRNSDNGAISNPGKLNAKTWIAAGTIGFLLLFLGNGGLSIGETTLPSGLAAVLVATVPVWMIIFARILQRERITLKKTTSVVIGLGGVTILLGNVSGSGRLSGMIIVLGASVAWGFGSVLGHRLTMPSNVILAAAIEMLVGGAVLLVVAAFSGEFSRVDWPRVSMTSWVALIYLIGPGSILAFTAYQYALSHLPVSTVATYAYVNPVIAVVAGTLILGEHLTLREGVGAALILGSVVITQLRWRNSRDTETPAVEISSSTATKCLPLSEVAAPVHGTLAPSAGPRPVQKRDMAVGAVANARDEIGDNEDQCVANDQCE